MTQPAASGQLGFACFRIPMLVCLRGSRLEPYSEPVSSLELLESQSPGLLCFPGTASGRACGLGGFRSFMGGEPPTMAGPSEPETPPRASARLRHPGVPTVPRFTTETQKVSPGQASCP